MVKTIGDACNISTGKLDANQAVKGGDYPFFTCAELPEQIDHYAFDGDVVLIAGNNARGNFHVSRYQGKFNAYQRTYVLTAKHGYDIDYIYYALRLELKRLREKSQGSQTKFLTMPILTSISLGNLVETEQSTVSRVLKILDKKIALNNRINAELEAMAKTLYDYWFVQFDFPDANGKPYKTSGGKMEYNATLKREIPAGWNDSILGKFIELDRGVTYSKEDVRTQDDKDTIGILRATNVTGNNVDIDDLVFIPSSRVNVNQMLNKFDILIVMSSGSKEHVGKNGVYYFEKKHAFGAFCSKITPVRKYRYFINTFLQSKWFKSYINNQCLGTNINNLTNTHITNCEIICPTPDVVALFENKMMPIYNKLASNTQENSHLIQLRDWLLPLLMNGQVTVK
ncbi:restriction endonuclease subunit S [Escherichia coli]|uniref:restriction endonuclease subunit S n=1 Tax=Escherichia coli TaxID=562 RepID=UPI00063D17AF|nr:restriction endonuclease subunit S [Escherichia coli]EKE9878135.1 restriction endonuclease subunit S [Escherichia coli]EKL7006761.1 restriction endonuclease subunit S [Escherichia coli]EKL7334915.1 restriction endonuclease subunit S [Escherichia coli]EKM2738124.1 restriction endonuclease subunit S [Escherichia coli]EKM2767885.1 restriction endonuclease subunit S [Escherichia coli]